MMRVWCTGKTFLGAATIVLSICGSFTCGDDSSGPSTDDADPDGDGYLAGSCGGSGGEQGGGGALPCSFDCYDTNADAHPGQTAWFETNRGDGSFDYNCDGIEEPEWPDHGSCYVMSGQCGPFTEGWYSSSAPACGESGSWLTSCVAMGAGCVTEARIQACR